MISLGIVARINYLKELGVGVVCLSNYLPMHGGSWFYPTSFINVDSRLGTLQDFELMVRMLHESDIKVQEVRRECCGQGQSIFQIISQYANIW